MGFLSNWKLGPLRVIRPYLPELNFITLHYAFFITTIFVFALVFWGSSTPFRSVSFTDALFLSASAITEAGLNTVNLSSINTWQQVMLFVLIIIGSPIFVSAFVVFVRLKVFEREFKEFKDDRRKRKQEKKGNRMQRARSFVTRYPSKSPTDAEKAASGNQESEGTGTLDEKSVAVHNDEADVARKHDEREGPMNIAAVLGNGHPTSPSQQRSFEEGRDEEFLSPGPRVGFRSDTRFERTPAEENEYKNKSLFNFHGPGATSGSLRRTATGIAPRSRDEAPLPTLRRAEPLQRVDSDNSTDLPFFLTGGLLSRNSQFHGLTFQERMDLGGYEYRAVVFLSFLVPVYLVAWQLLGAVSLGAWVKYHRPDIALQDGIGPFWVGSYNAISAFNNSGMSLLDANMVAFQRSVFMCLSMGLFILAGNTAYPIFLRATVWSLWKLLPNNKDWLEEKKTLRFLLDHPRRVYTNMFPSRHTWWLAATLVALNVIDWVAYAVLNIGHRAITKYPAGIEVLDGLFQALAVRSGGFYVVPIPDLRISLQFLYVIMMYISVYPVTISIRNSNLYEERSLGIFAEDAESGQGPAQAAPPGTGEEKSATPASPSPGRLKRAMTNLKENAAPAPAREKRSYFVRQQLRAQLAHDAWLVVIAVFLILIIEVSQFENDPVNFSVFNVIFEVVSAYGCVGMSLGVTYDSYSFSGSWSVLSKLILVFVMVRGRHRGLPVAIDHAIQLPGKWLWDAEDEDGQRRQFSFEREQTLKSPVALARSQTVGVTLGSPTALSSRLGRGSLPQQSKTD